MASPKALYEMVQRPYRTIFIGLLGSVICLWLAAWQVNLADVLRVLTGLQGGYLFLSVVSSFACFGIRAVRWGVLLRPIKAVQFRSLLVAELIGFMVNNLFPLRMGEVAKSLTLNRIEGVRVSAALGAVAAGGLLNMITLGMLLLVTLGVGRSVELVGWQLLVGCITAVLILVGLAVCCAVVKRRRGSNCGFAQGIFPAGVLRIEQTVRGFFTGVCSLGSPRRTLTAGLLSLLLWLCMAGRFFFTALAMGVPLSLHAAVVVQAIVGIGSGVPSAPAQLGAFELSAVFGLQLFSIDKETAFACALLVRLIYFLPATVIGLVCAWKVGLQYRPGWRREVLVPAS